MKNFLIGISLITSLVICFLLGSRMLLHGDFFYLSDQARDFTLVRDIVITHKLTLIGTHSGIGGLFHGPLWLYMLVPFFIFGKGNPFIFTYWYAAIPLFTILVGFFIGRKLYGKTFGTIVAFLLAINSILWGYITNTLEINLIPLLFILFIYFTISYIRGNQKAFILVAFLAGLSFQLEIASAIAILPIVVFVLLLGKKIPSFKSLFLSAVAFVISLSTFILFDIRHQFLIFKSTLQLFNQSQGSKDYVTIFARVVDHLGGLKDTYLSVLFTKNVNTVVLLVIMVGYFIFLLYKNHADGIKVKEFIFLSITPLIVYALYMLYPHPIYGEYVLDLPVALIFALGIILTTLWSTPIGKTLSGFFLITTVLWVIYYVQTTYAAAYIPNTSSGSYLNQEHAIEWIWKDAEGKPFTYFVYTPETFTYGADYLIWWNSKQLQVLLPESKKSNLTYLILYPPLANDTHAYDYWKENTIHTKAPVEKEVVLSGNIVIQKIDTSKDTMGVDANYYQNLIFR